jgi:SAM-dependent methyltransferase
MLGPVADKRILDLGCGNGVFARRLARAGARVAAVDVSAAMIDKARSRTSRADGRIEYGVLDATSEESLSALEAGFDAVVSNMVLMDLADLGPLARHLPRLLHEGGCFLFAVTHPSFNNGSGATRVAERYTAEEGLLYRHYIKVTGYITPVAERSRGICNQDVQYSFHRPLSALLAPFLEHELVLDRLEEPVFASAEGEGPLGQGQYSEIPWALVARLRQGSATD